MCLKKVFNSFSSSRARIKHLSAASKEGELGIESSSNKLIIRSAIISNLGGLGHSEMRLDLITNQYIAYVIAQICDYAAISLVLSDFRDFLICIDSQHHQAPTSTNEHQDSPLIQAYLLWGAWQYQSAIAITESQYQTLTL